MHGHAALPFRLVALCTPRADGACMLHSPIFQSFCDVQSAAVPLLRSWDDRREAATLEYALSDARHHCCCAAAFLDDLDARYDSLAEVEKLVAHEAYVSLVALAQQLRSAIEDNLPGREDIEGLLAATARALAILGPFSSRCDRSMAAIVLEGFELDAPSPPPPSDDELDTYTRIFERVAEPSLHELPTWRFERVAEADIVESFDAR